MVGVLAMLRVRGGSGGANGSLPAGAAVRNPPRAPPRVPLRPRLAAGTGSGAESSESSVLK